MSRLYPWGLPVAPRDASQIVQEAADQINERLFDQPTRAQLRQLVPLLHAGSATNAQVQRGLEAVIRALIRMEDA